MGRVAKRVAGTRGREPQVASVRGDRRSVLAQERDEQVAGVDRTVPGTARLLTCGVDQLLGGRVQVLAGRGRRVRVAQVAQGELTPGVGFDAHLTNECRALLDEDHPDVVLTDRDASRRGRQGVCPCDHHGLRCEPPVLPRHRPKRSHRCRAIWRLANRARSPRHVRRKLPATIMRRWPLTRSSS